MNTLVCDIGNTRIKLFLFCKGRIVRSLTLSEKPFKQLKKEIDTWSFSGGIIASVRPLPAHFNAWAEKRKLLLAHTGLSFPFTIQYKQQHTLGIDRLAGVAGALSLFPKKNLLVIDAGTCITFDMLEKKGVYRGGSIAPGIQMRLKALHAFTGKLPLINTQKGVPALIGDSTKYSILSGVYNGIAAETDGMIEAYRKKYTDLQVVLTGGDAPFFEKALKNRIFAHPNLVALGLYSIFNRTHGK